MYFARFVPPSSLLILVFDEIYSTISLVCLYICSAIKNHIKGKTRRSKLLAPDRLNLMLGELMQAAHVHVSVSNATTGKGSNTAAQTI